MNREELFNTIKRAIEDEEKAHNFYLEAATLASDPAIKVTFERLAEMELTHAEMLRETYASLRDKTS